MKWRACVCSVTQLCLVLCDPHGPLPSKLLCLWDFPRRNTGVGCHFLLQGILPTQGSNPHLLHCQADSLPLNHLRSPDSTYSQTSIDIGSHARSHKYKTADSLVTNKKVLLLVSYVSWTSNGYLDILWPWVLSIDLSSYYFVFNCSK